MRRLLVLFLAIAASGLGVSVPGSAATGPVRTLALSGTDVTMYPAFDPAITRYAATTTAATAGTLSITATPAGSGDVLVNGWPATTATTTVSGLAAGDEVSVIFEDADGRTAYSVMYLPAGFPALDVTVDDRANEEPGLIALTPNAFNVLVSQPSYNAIVDRNGVPVYAILSGAGDFDLKQQPTGEITVFRPTTMSGHTGTALVTLDDQLADGSRHEVVSPLTNTDNHDSVRLPDGSTILLGYEPNLATGKTDATIQKLDADGHETFRWTSAPFVDESVMPDTNKDYAHINSVVSAENDDVIASFRHLSAVFRIATVAHDTYAKGQVIWKLGGRDSTFTFPNDPLGGPCGQHTASELPNGHILVFDNGTSSLGAAPSLCVDPADRLGPTIDRNFTRIAECALDTDTNTASLVWTYPSDHSRYTYFAGSARRLANGNTLIGWSVDVHALATEVDPAGNTVWEVTTPVPPSTPPGLRQYATYRAALIPDVPDRIDPVITPGTGEDAIHVVGDSVAPEYRCADRGGSNLQTCTTTGLVGGRLDTSTVGPQTWQVEATDGAGNTTTVVRNYTVRLPGRQPDGSIRKARASWWRGVGILGSTAGQTIRQRVRRTDTTVAVWQVRNEGERADGFRLVGTGNHAHVKVRYFAGGVDVTRTVVAGTYRTAILAPGQSVSLRVEVTPTRRSRVGSTRRFALRAVSVSDATRIDRVATAVTTR